MKKFKYLSKNWKFIVPVVLAVALVAFYFGGKIYSDQAINNILSDINQTEENLSEYAIEEVKTINKISKNTKEIDVYSANKYSDNKSLLAESERILNQFIERFSDKCKEYDYSERLKTNFLVRAYEKNKVEKLNDISEIVKKVGKENCDQIKGASSSFKYTLELVEATNELTKAESENYEDITALAKFSNGSFVIEDESEIAEIYTQDQVDWLNAQADAFALIYESAKAADESKFELSDKKIEQYISQQKKADGLQQSADDKYLQSSKNKARDDLKDQIVFFNLLKKLNVDPDKTGYSSGVSNAVLLQAALSSYYPDHERKYPTKLNFNQLVKLLKNERYLDDVEIDPADMKYSSNNDQGYTLKFKSNSGEGFTYKEQL